ncbi:zincin [Serendipita vermifera]|nr:zincin [Serendipita vermifera]
MLSTLFVLALASLAAATPLKRTPGLVVTLSTPEASIESINDISLTATVENTSDEDIKVLKIGTVLDAGLPTRSFTVTKGGSEVAFEGVKVQLSMSDLTEESFVVIPAGGSVSATHENLGNLYNFESLGTGTFSFTPKTDFQVAKADSLVQDIADTVRVTSSVPTVDINVASDVAKRELKVLDKRARVSCSTSSYSSFISSSYTEGKSLASLAASYISSRGASDSLFKAYFGSQSTSKPLSVFNAVASENSSSRTLSCSDPYSVCGNGVIAYTLTATTNIYYCSIFYNEVTTSRLCSGTTVASRNIRGGTTLHELTHALSGTTDVGYGCSYDQQLAQSSPSRAASNADNYNCFATQVYQNTQC